MKARTLLKIMFVLIMLLSVVWAISSLSRANQRQGNWVLINKDRVDGELTVLMMPQHDSITTMDINEAMSIAREHILSVEKN